MGLRASDLSLLLCLSLVQPVVAMSQSTVVKPHYVGVDLGYERDGRGL